MFTRNYLRDMRLKNEADAEELVQDVFLKVWEKREILDASQNIKAIFLK